MTDEQPERFFGEHIREAKEVFRPLFQQGHGSHDRLVGCGQRHVLKTWPEYFEKILDGTKTFELREDDRGFDVGHELVLVEYSPVADMLTGRKVIRRVTYIMRGPSFGLDAGWCVMALAAPNMAHQLPPQT